jgi:hypothetical protein
MKDPLFQVIAIFGSVGRGQGINAISPDCVVVGNPTGITRGWFMHPFNFDPVWLMSCTGFKEREDEPNVT